MERTLNRVELRGNVGSEPKITTLESGATVVRFSLATHETFKGRDGNFKEETTWHSIVAWASKSMPDLTNLRKGDFLEIVGRIRYYKYRSKEGGDEKFATEIVAQKIALPETIS